MLIPGFDTFFFPSPCFSTKYGVFLASQGIKINCAAKFVARVVTQVTKSLHYILFLILEDVPEKFNLSNRVCVVKTRFLNLFTTNNFL